MIACDEAVWDPSESQVAPVPVFWDLTLQTFVSFSTGPSGEYPQYPYSEGGDGSVIGLAGNDLVVVQGNQTVETVLFLNTSMLPTTPAAG